MSLSLVVAMAEGRVIGRDNALPWRISEELKLFKKITTGHPVVMGRKTWDSIGRPLPNRLNVVVTRQKDLRLEGALVAGSLDDALRMAGERAAEWGDEVMLIGGGELYRQALPRADRLYLTRVLAAIPGDTYFPPFDEAQWTASEIARGDGPPPWVMERLDRA